MKLLSVVGARPQFVKLAPIAAAVERGTVEHVIVHTGQHYDPNMSQEFFDFLEIPDPDVNLAIGSAGHGVQTGAMMAALDGVFLEHKPDWVLVYGDTNSTLAAAICAAKLHIRIAHLEAGIRSFNRRMPEEHNRVLTDHCSDLLLAPTAVALAHLTREGLAERTVVVGDVMADVCFAVRDRINSVSTPQTLPFDTSVPYRLATIHRPDNTDSPERLAAILEALRQLPGRTILAAHPRLSAKAEAFGLDLDGGGLTTTAPLTYPDLIAAVMGSVGVVTDSGGLQKEAYMLERLCTTVRTETEWVETVESGWNALASRPEMILELATRSAPTSLPSAVYGDGAAAVAAIHAIEDVPDVDA